MSSLCVRITFCVVAIFVIAGCAVNPRDNIQIDAKNSHWHGRIAVQVDPKPDAPSDLPKSFSSSFELAGNSEVGELTFLTPLGSTAATIHWHPRQAEMVSQGKTSKFSGLDELLLELAGTDLPVGALFAWLDGRELMANGWQVDLTGFAQGKILAQRLSPQPRARLRLVLEP